MSRRGDIRVYLRSRVEKLPRGEARLTFFRDENDSEEYCDEGGVVGSGGGSGLDWESWIAGQWPQVVNEGVEGCPSLKLD